MIYITGDCHQDFERFNMKNFPEQRELTKDDHVIICGDFGGVWNKNEESKKEKALLDCRFVKHMLHHQVRNHLKQFEEISIPAGA